MAATDGYAPSSDRDPRFGFDSMETLESKLRPAVLRPGIIPRTAIVDRLFASQYQPVVPAPSSIAALTRFAPALSFTRTQAIGLL
jgi:hypothetical protein